ncbi:MAG: hypothetical protein FWC51_04135 [Proteobacteria bacterium]|nr:hypothetical protein [Pseudomonadota bacterium]
MKKLSVILLSAALPLAACDRAPKSDYDTITAQIGNCQKMSTVGPRGDFIVLCPVTDKLISIAQKTPNSKFLSTTAIDREKKFNQSVVINVIPDANNPCYRILAANLSMDTLPTGDNAWYAVQICKK